MVGLATTHTHPGWDNTKTQGTSSINYDSLSSLSLLQKAKVSSSKLHAIEVLNYPSYSLTHKRAKLLASHLKLIINSYLIFVGRQD